jgi:hypothetical protein
MAGDVVFPRRATTREGDTAVMATRMAAGVVARCVAAVVAAIARRVAMPDSVHTAIAVACDARTHDVQP